MSIVLAIALFIAFTIGLNLGLHGVIVLNRTEVLNEQSAVLAQSTRSHISQPQQRQTRPPGSTAEKPLTHSIAPHKASSDAATMTNAPVVVSRTADTVSAPPPTPPRREATVVFEEETRREDKGKGESESTEVWQKHLKPVDDQIQAMVRERERLSVSTKSYADTPIVLMTCNRPRLLEETLQSLLAVRGVTKEKILLVQDGALPEIQQVAQRFDVRCLRNEKALRLRGGAGEDGAARIAQHYKFALSSAFDHFAKAEAIIVVEDDLLFSPDFYEFLTQTAPVLDADPSTFVVSAWNDNGFSDKVKEPYALRRTDFFSGLGWLLPRKLYKEELERAWPNEHWDHWLRSPAVHKNRETVNPQVPRTFHNGVKGTFMNTEMHNRYFRDIAYNQNPSVAWTDSRQTHTIHADVYERRIESLVKSCKHVTSVTELALMTSEI